MKLVALVLVFVLSTDICLAQKEINFMPKQLFKDISRIHLCENPKIVAIENNSELVADSLIEKYFTLSNSSHLGYIYVGRVKTCRAGVCAAPDLFKKDSYEFFDYSILYDSMAKVLNVNIFNYEATHGQEITVKSWLQQFVGFDGKEDLTVGKNIDAISGATISVYGITDDISNKTEKLRNYLMKNNKPLQ